MSQTTPPSVGWLLALSPHRLEVCLLHQHGYTGHKHENLGLKPGPVRIIFIVLERCMGSHPGGWWSAGL